MGADEGAGWTDAIRDFVTPFVDLLRDSDLHTQ